MVIAREASSRLLDRASTITRSRKPWCTRERAVESPLGPAPMIRTVVLSGKDMMVLVSKISKLHKTAELLPYRSILLNITMSSTSAAVNADRFLADRAAPICGLDIGRSFEQLRS